LVRHPENIGAASRRRSQKAGAQIVASILRRLQTNAGGMPLDDHD
jgi:hypothetical protein